MATKALLWDTCVLYRWFQPDETDYVDHIKKYLEESAAGAVDIYLSSISLAEIKPSAVSKSGFTPLQIVSAISNSFILVDTSPDIMSLAGYLRDQRYRHVDGPTDRAAERPLSLGDSIHLATAVALREEYGVQNLTIHTFDLGRKKDFEHEKKTVPMIGFENWTRDCPSDEQVQKVIALERKMPEHPSCQLPKIKSNGSKKPPENSNATTTTPPTPPH